MHNRRCQGQVWRQRGRSAQRVEARVGLEKCYDSVRGLGADVLRGQLGSDDFVLHDGPEEHDDGEMVVHAKNVHRS